MKMGRIMTRLKKKRTSGFRARNKTKGGKKIFKRRRARGCKELGK
ncbi:MAG: bL34 family ribosomal protein [Planctomycetota bacterium]|nr:bL34 family ribosomal protein [Planctomycetota bacterium]MDA1138474.1 bL34 family ribosomal protein [Planctomycetota bacterium]